MPTIDDNDSLKRMKESMGTPKDIYDNLENEIPEVQILALIRGQKWQESQMNRDYLLFKESIQKRIEALEKIVEIKTDLEWDGDFKDRICYDDGEGTIWFEIGLFGKTIAITDQEEEISIHKKHIPILINYLQGIVKKETESEPETPKCVLNDTCQEKPSDKPCPPLMPCFLTPKKGYTKEDVLKEIQEKCNHKWKPLGFDYSQEICCYCGMKKKKEPESEQTPKTIEQIIKNTMEHPEKWTEEGKYTTDYKHLNGKDGLVDIRNESEPNPTKQPIDIYTKLIKILYYSKMDNGDQTEYFTKELENLIYGRMKELNSICDICHVDGHYAVFDGVCAECGREIIEEYRKNMEDGGKI